MVRKRIQANVRCMCRQCDRVFLSKPNTRGFFCSAKCHFLYKREHYEGITTEGYVIVYAPSGFTTGRADGRILKHRLTMAIAINRNLNDNETVHHKNGNRLDNNISNLQLRFGQHGKGSTQHCETCTCIIAED